MIWTGFRLPQPDDAIDEAKSQITFRQEGAVKQKEMVR